MGQQLELYEERAAIKQFDAKLPKGIAEAQAHKETIVIVPWDLACRMARSGFSIGKMIRTQYYKKWTSPFPTPSDGNPMGSARVGRNVGKGPFSRTK